ncbi:hypothetical protein F4779DRAFT_560022 [Xylariaceae sp. FL0662B]|nr:hypothetical protein F4779DRAFT_560022 [Xylariaceae sp. FL0662B]
MFLSTLLGISSGRSGSPRSTKFRSSGNTPEASPSRSRSPDVSSSDYLSDESQLQPVAPPPEHLLDLNNNLETLAALFPDIQVEVFREMLASFSEESRLFIITDKLLKNPAAFVKGRRRASDHDPNAKVLVPRAEAFRTPEYKKAVKALAVREFKGLSKSSIDAVLSETNYSYLDARPTLVALSSRLWRFTMPFSFFRRRHVPSAEVETHPLIRWIHSVGGTLIPTIKPTGNAELDRELFDELIIPLQRREQASREENDHALAMSLHTEEAEAYEATYECTCCFTDGVFEEFTTCTAEGHMVCFRCIQHSITEAVFGQGWQRSIDKDMGTLRCPAVASAECDGCISSEHIRRAVRGEKNGDEILRKLDERLAEHGLLSSGLPLVRCPFCSYAEVDELYMPAGAPTLKLRASNIPSMVIIFIFLIMLLSSFPILILGPLSVIMYLNQSLRDYALGPFRAAIGRYQRRRRGLKFTCQNPACGRPSCLSCSKEWVDIHVCHESSLIALRTQVEQAMSMAVKRVCPRCNTSFVKEAGCNKMACPCGYKMCYVCRKDIGSQNEGYQHFCQHFRPEGDGRKCQECNKCNLWEKENTEALLQKAKAEVEREWSETEKRELSDAEKAYLQDGVGSFGQKDRRLRRLVPSSKVLRINELCDYIVETLFV